MRMGRESPRKGRGARTPRRRTRRRRRGKRTMRPLRIGTNSRDVNLILSFFDVYAVISKPVCNLAKKDVFTY
jgi:hypothetical protein